MKYITKRQSNGKMLKFLLFFIVAISSVFLASGLFIEKNYTNISNNIESYQYSAGNTDSLYLSDIDYAAWFSYVGWDEIRYDQIVDGSKISLKIENRTFSFDKGIWAPAGSQILYDLSAYNYKYFTAIVGINTTSTGLSFGKSHTK